MFFFVSGPRKPGGEEPPKTARTPQMAQAWAEIADVTVSKSKEGRVSLGRQYVYRKTDRPESAEQAWAPHH